MKKKIIGIIILIIVVIVIIAIGCGVKKSHDKEVAAQRAAITKELGDMNVNYVTARFNLGYKNQQCTGLDELKNVVNTNVTQLNALLNNKYNTPADLTTEKSQLSVYEKINTVVEVYEQLKSLNTELNNMGDYPTVDELNNVVNKVQSILNGQLMQDLTNDQNDKAFITMWGENPVPVIKKGLNSITQGVQKEIIADEELQAL